MVIKIFIVGFLAVHILRHLLQGTFPGQPFPVEQLQFPPCAYHTITATIDFDFPGLSQGKTSLAPAERLCDNVAYGLKIRKLPKEEIKERVLNILKLVEMDGMESRMTNQLSGGQQQRVALARALVIEPSVLLFDEPLSNLDAKLRVTMRTEIRKIQQKVGITAIYVTHDQSEAMSISDKIIIMSKGKVEQIGTPREIYYHPKSRFVADFIGEANFLKAKVKSAQGEKAVIDVIGEEIEVNNYGEKQPVMMPVWFFVRKQLFFLKKDFWKERLSCQHSWVPISIIR